MKIFVPADVCAVLREGVTPGELVLLPIDKDYELKTVCHYGARTPARDVLRDALLQGAAGVITARISLDSAEPKSTNVKTIMGLKNAFEMIGIYHLDHMVFATKDTAYWSAREHGVIFDGKEEDIGLFKEES